MIMMIAATDKNGVIGKNGKIPWKLKDDMKMFRKLTMGNTVLMGRKTYESLPGPLKGRGIIILTRSKDFKPRRNNEIVLHSKDEAINWFCDNMHYKSLEWIPNPSGHLFIMGGGEIYKEFLDLSGRLYLTEVDTEIENADVFFSAHPSYFLESDEWHLSASGNFQKSSRNEYNFTLSVFDKYESF